MRTYYDIGLNLFTRSFPDPERIIAGLEAAGICCILTGSEARENELVNEFVKTHDVYGTAGIHPHAADDAADEDLERIEEIILSNPKIVAVGNADWIMTGCIRRRKTSFIISKADCSRRETEEAAVPP